MLYEPQDLQTLCGIVSSPHLEHLIRLTSAIFQFALLLSRLAFDDLFFGQMDTSHTSLYIHLYNSNNHNRTRKSIHGEAPNVKRVPPRILRIFSIILYVFQSSDSGFGRGTYLTSATVSRQIISSSFVGMTQTSTLESSVEIFTFSPRMLFFS